MERGGIPRRCSAFSVGWRPRDEARARRFEGQVVACFVKCDLKTVRYVIESDDGALHIASERQSRLAMPKGPETA
jgi:hypothetical protein